MVGHTEGQVYGIVAGNGALPGEIICRLRQQSKQVVLASLEGIASLDLREKTERHKAFQVGKVGSILRYFHDEDVDTVIFIGGVPRKNSLLKIRPDFEGIKFLFSLGFAKGDDRVLKALASLFESKGFNVIGADQILSDWVFSKPLGRVRLKHTELEDMKLGWKAAEKLGELDVGQAVIVSNGVVVSLEGLEGTAELIRRSKPLISKPAVLVKRSKPAQELRIDMPTIGPETIELMSEAGITALILERDKVLCIHPQRVSELAQHYNIAITPYMD